MAIKFKQNGDGISYLSVGVIEKVVVSALAALLIGGFSTALAVWRQQSVDKIHFDDMLAADKVLNESLVEPIHQNALILTNHEGRIIILETKEDARSKKVRER